MRRWSARQLLRRNGRLLKAIVLLLLITCITYSSALAHGKVAKCREFVGTYLITLFEDDGTMNSRSLISLRADGNFSFIDSNQGGVPGEFNPFTEAAGSWTCKRNGKKGKVATMTGLDFTLPGTEGPNQQIARLDFFHVTVNRKTGHIQGSGKLRFFPFDSNPLDPPSDLEDSFLFEGERVTARPIRDSRSWISSDD